MKKNSVVKLLSLVATLVIFSIMLTTSTATAQEGNPNNIVEVNIQPTSITWIPLVSDISGMTLTIMGFLQMKIHTAPILGQPMSTEVVQPIIFHLMCAQLAGMVFRSTAFMLLVVFVV